MSASLVGSEMCIRDSGACASKRAIVPWLSPWASRRRCLHASRTGHAKPVSYTHLTLPTICSV
eukprot:13322841-Alexandrium_andersonii.AAC.1